MFFVNSVSFSVEVWCVALGAIFLYTERFCMSVEGLLWNEMCTSVLHGGWIGWSERFKIVCNRRDGDLEKVQTHARSYYKALEEGFLLSGD